MVRTLADADVAGKRVLVRVDLNVPLKKGRVADETRIQAMLPTVHYLRDKGAKVILCSHLGRPKGKPVPEMSLEPVARRLRKLGVPVAFVADCIGEEVQSAVAALAPGDVLLLENLRFYEGETENDDDFASQLASLADVFVNDAFGTAHRAHASTVGVATRLPSYAGLLIQTEVEALGKALHDPKRPFTAVLGGAKVSDKIAVLERLVEQADRVVVGGGMAFTFLHAMGHNVGKSLVEKERVEMASRIMEKAQANGIEFLLPIDIEEAAAFERGADHRAVMLGSMDPNWMGLDIGPLTMDRFAKAIRNSGTVLWNGPMGVFEWPAFQFGTRAIAQAMVDCPGITIVGGGDSAAAAAQFKITQHVTHISTGGGASLEFLEGKTLPGIAVLE